MQNNFCSGINCPEYNFAGRVIYFRRTRDTWPRHLVANRAPRPSRAVPVEITLYNWDVWRQMDSIPSPLLITVPFQSNVHVLQFQLRPRLCCS